MSGILDRLDSIIFGTICFICFIKFYIMFHKEGGKNHSNSNITNYGHFPTTIPQFNPSMAWLEKTIQVITLLCSIGFAVFPKSKPKEFCRNKVVLAPVDGRKW
jgi:hypothetical protein